MKKRYFLTIIVMISLSITAYPQPMKQIQGFWRSYNRQDTMTISFTDTLAYFMTPSIEALNQNVYSFFIYNLSGQLMIQIISPNRKSEGRFRLWFVGQKEIKIQSIDPEDFNNPQKHIPKESDKNTFYLRKLF